MLERFMFKWWNVFFYSAQMFNYALEYKNILYIFIKLFKFIFCNIYSPHNMPSCVIFDCCEFHIPAVYI